MFSRICKLLAGNFRSNVGMCPSFQVARLMHNAHKDSKATAIKGAEFQNVLRINPTCGLFASKPIPVIELISSVNSRILDFPPSRASLPFDKWDSLPEVKINELPGKTTVEKQAARLIVIRRRKMKKHKLKKLRKKMKFEWGKVRQRRELRKEKLFQAKLIAQMKEAEAFDAAEYVSEKLRKVELSQLEGKKETFKKNM